MTMPRIHFDDLARLGVTLEEVREWHVWGDFPMDAKPRPAARYRDISRLVFHVAEGINGRSILEDVIGEGEAIEVFVPDVLIEGVAGIPPDFEESRAFTRAADGASSSVFVGNFGRGKMQSMWLEAAAALCAGKHNVRDWQWDRALNGATGTGSSGFVLRNVEDPMVRLARVGAGEVVGLRGPRLIECGSSTFRMGESTIYSSMLFTEGAQLVPVRHEHKTQQTRLFAQKRRDQ